MGQGVSAAENLVHGKQHARAPDPKEERPAQLVIELVLELIETLSED